MKKSIFKKNEKNKMLTKNEMGILEVYRNDLLGVFTIRELASKLHKKSYAWTFNAVKKLSNMNVLRAEKKGKAVLCSINLNENKTLTYLSLLDTIASDRLPMNNITNAMKLIPTPFFIFLVTGSYAKQTQTAKSDIDIIVIVGDCQNTKKILVLIQNAGGLMHPEIHPYIFTKTQYIKMLLADEMNYGKLSYKNRIIVYGAPNYYRIIREAIHHGFRG